MNNGILVQNIYGKVGLDGNLPRPLAGAPCLTPMPYHYPGGDWKIDLKRLVLVFDTSLQNNTTISVFMAGTPISYEVDWGDGYIERISSANGIGLSHRYASHGIYVVQVRNMFNGLAPNAPRLTGATALTKIVSFGTAIGSADYNAAFGGCPNLTNVAANLPISTTNLVLMFNSSPRVNDPNIALWNTVNVTNFQAVFQNCSSFNQPIGTWNTSNATTMDAMMNGCSLFNQDVGSWDVSKVTAFNSLFLNCSSFNNGESNSINNWNTGLGQSMVSMFQGASRFNQPLNNWNVRKVTNFSSMFSGATSFNSSLSGWALGADTVGTNCASMFINATSFNQDIGNWNTTKITNISNMFAGATSFNQPLSSWDTTSVTNMAGCFSTAHSFNQNIGSWNVNKVTDFNTMFFANFGFNNGGSSDINNWNINTLSPVNMFRMFYDNKPFNQPLGNWNVSRVTNMGQMFPYAAFDQNISGWNIASVTNLTQMRAFGGGFSTPNYDALLIGWNNNKLASSNGIADWSTTLTPTFGASKYTAGGAAAAARAALVSYGWTITDNGTA